jgi:molecular chaperone DnaK
MLAEAEKYASADKEKRETIDLKNQAETLCFEAEKNFLFKENIDEENNNKILQN